MANQEAHREENGIRQNNHFSMALGFYIHYFIKFLQLCEVGGLNITLQM